MTEFTKTLLLDFSNIAHATYHIMKCDSSLKTDAEKFDYWRFLMLSMIKNVKIKHQPSEYIICVDSMSWRRKAFKYYKANRDDLKKDADFDYQYFLENMQLFTKEVDQNFHYKVISYNGAEADDIIAILAAELSKVRDKIIIASNDKDFKQLIRNNIHLWNIKDKKFIEVEDCREYLIFHILNGDSGDGVPNVRSDDDVFVDKGKRQKPCGAKQISKILEEGLQTYIEREGLKRNFARNRKLVDLSKNYIPESIWNGVMEKYNSIPDKQKNYKNILMYFSRHGLRSLMDEVNLFM